MLGNIVGKAAGAMKGVAGSVMPGGLKPRSPMMDAKMPMQKGAASVGVGSMLRRPGPNRKMTGAR
mgnify:CR=1 FL=1